MLERTQHFEALDKARKREASSGHKEYLMTFCRERNACLIITLIRKNVCIKNAIIVQGRKWVTYFTRHISLFGLTFFLSICIKNHEPLSHEK